MAAEELLFERKDAKHMAERAAHSGQPALAPGPNLRRHQVHHRDALAVQFAGQAQMEVGRIREDGQIRPAALRGGL